MLKTILSISGKPGLFKLISQAKNMLIVESLQTGKRQPAYAHEKIISLGDIAIFTDEEDVPLSEVLNAIKEKENGAKVTLDIKPIMKHCVHIWRKCCLISTVNVSIRPI